VQHEQAHSCRVRAPGGSRQLRTMPALVVNFLSRAPARGGCAFARQIHIPKAKSRGCCEETSSAERADGDRLRLAARCPPGKLLNFSFGFLTHVCRSVRIAGMHDRTLIGAVRNLARNIGVRGARETGGNHATFN
jgi:hypothetical protein